MFGDFSLLAEFGIETKDASRIAIAKNQEEYKEKYIKWYLKNVLKSQKEYEELKKNLEAKIADNSEKLRAYLIDGLKKAGKRASDVDRFLGTNGMAGHYFGRSQWEFPTREVYIKLQGFLYLPQDYEEIYGLQELYESLQSLQRLESMESLQNLQRLQSMERLQRLQSMERLQNLQRLQSMERLQRLQSMERLQSYKKLFSSSKDYRDVKILPDSVIYCDIPYKGTDEYNAGGFNHDEFYSWCAKQKELVLISSYEMPKDFIEIASFSHRSTLCSGKGSLKVTEKVFIPKHQEKLYKSLMNKELKPIWTQLEFDFTF